ncbi:hypothetical protein SPV3_ORF21 [Sulfolobus polyhedral virus 3]|nr:hypothetical protein SPV3_ORF21 [Sulfolobus polyhedral virus 3]
MSQPTLYYPISSTTRESITKTPLLSNLSFFSPPPPPHHNLPHRHFYDRLSDRDANLR